MATLLTGEIKTSFADFALALGDPMARQLILAYGMPGLLYADEYELNPCEQESWAFNHIVETASYLSREFGMEYFEAKGENTNKGFSDEIYSSFTNLARHILTPSYALIAADTIRHYEGPDSGEYGFYWDLTAEQKILSDVVREILVRLDGAIKRYLGNPPKSESDNRKEENGKANADYEEDGWSKDARIGSLADCVRDGILKSYSSFEEWQVVAKDILKYNAPDVYKEMRIAESIAPGVKITRVLKNK